MTAIIAIYLANLTLFFVYLTWKGATEDERQSR